MDETAWVPRHWDDRLPAQFRASFEYPDGAPIEGLVMTAQDFARFGRAVLRGWVSRCGASAGERSAAGSAFVRQLLAAVVAAAPSPAG